MAQWLRQWLRCQGYKDTRIQDILFCAYNYTHVRQSIQEHNIHKYTIQTQKLQILYKLNCSAVSD